MPGPQMHMFHETVQANNGAFFVHCHECSGCGNVDVHRVESKSDGKSFQQTPGWRWIDADLEVEA